MRKLIAALLAPFILLASAAAPQTAAPVVPMVAASVLSAAVLATPDEAEAGRPLRGAGSGSALLTSWDGTLKCSCINRSTTSVANDTAAITTSGSPGYGTILTSTSSSGDMDFTVVVDAVGPGMSVGYVQAAQPLGPGANGYIGVSGQPGFSFSPNGHYFEGDSDLGAVADPWTTGSVVRVVYIRSTGKAQASVDGGPLKPAGGQSVGSSFSGAVYGAATLQENGATAASVRLTGSNF